MLHHLGSKIDRTSLEFPADAIKIRSSVAWVGFDRILDPLREVCLMAQAPLKNVLVITAVTLKFVVWSRQLTIFGPLKGDDARVRVAHKRLT